MTEPLVALAWTQRVDAVTLAVVSGLDVEARLREITGGPVEESRDDFDSAYAKGGLGTPNRVPVQFDSAPGGEVLIEPNGYLMSTYAEEMTRKGGSLVSVYWCDAIGRGLVTFARDGRVVRAFEPDDRERGEGEQQPEEADLPWESNPRPAMVALFERVAMLPITEDWLTSTPRPTWLVVEPPRV